VNATKKKKISKRETLVIDKQYMHLNFNYSKFVFLNPIKPVCIIIK